MKNNKLLLIVNVFAITLWVAPVAQAAVILSPVSASTNMGSADPIAEPLSATIDQSGLFTTFTSGVTDFDVYIALNPLHEPQTFVSPPNAWVSNFINTGNLDYDLGETLTIEKIAFWNDDRAGIINVTVLTDTSPTFATATNVGSFVLADTPDDVALIAQVLDPTDSIGRYVRLEVSGSQDGSSHVSYAEIAFGVVPEPSRALLTLLGIGVVLVRRKRF